MKMTKCAYCGNEINDNKIITHCRNGCHKSLFFCACGATNRTTAIYCRSCGKEVSYVDTLNRYTKSLKMSHSAFDKQLFELPLSQLGVIRDDELPRLYFSYGYIFLIFAVGKIIVLSSGNGEVQATIEFPDKISTLPLDISDKQSKSLFMFADSEIYRIDLIRDFSHEFLMNIGDEGFELASQPIYFDRYFLLTLKHNSATQIKLVSLDGDHRDIISLNSVISQPIQAKNKVFFHTQDEIFVYDHSTKSISYRNENKHHFVIQSDPKSDGTRVYALTDDERLYRINLEDKTPEIFGLPHPQLMQVNFEVADGRIIIAHSAGLLVTNILGQTEWSSDELLNSYPAYKFLPTSFGNYISFVMSYPNTEVLHIIETNGYKQAGSCLGNFLLRPMYYGGNIYTVVDEDTNIIMRVYTL
jgi:hypothetical protein